MAPPAARAPSSEPAPVRRLYEQLRAAPLRTERLALRPLRADDAGAIYHGYATDAEAIRWMGFRPHENVATTEHLVAEWVKHWEEGTGHMFFVVEAADDARFLGIVDLGLGAHGGLLSYVVCRPAWGRGIATEAARSVVNLGFERFGLWRVWATCAPQNPASHRVLEKVGMRHEGVLRRWIVSPLVSPEPRDSDCLAITRDDWLTRRQGPVDAAG